MYVCGCVCVGTTVNEDILHDPLPVVCHPLPFVKRFFKCEPKLLTTSAALVGPPPVYGDKTTELFVPVRALQDIGDHLVYAAPNKRSPAVLKLRIAANHWTKPLDVSPPIRKRHGVKVDVVRSFLGEDEEEGVLLCFLMPNGVVAAGIGYSSSMRAVIEVPAAGPGHRERRVSGHGEVLCPGHTAA